MHSSELAQALKSRDHLAIDTLTEQLVKPAARIESSSLPTLHMLRDSLSAD